MLRNLLMFKTFWVTATREDLGLKQRRDEVVNRALKIFFNIFSGSNKENKLTKKAVKEGSDIRGKPKMYIIQMLTKKKWLVQILCAKINRYSGAWLVIGLRTKQVIVPSK